MVIIDDSYPDNNRSSASHFIDWLNTKAGQDIPRLITDLKSKDYSDDPEKLKRTWICVVKLYFITSSV